MKGSLVVHLVFIIWAIGAVNSSLYTILKAGWDVYEVKGFAYQPAKKLDLMKQHLMALDEIDGLTKADSVPKYAAVLEVEELHGLNGNISTINTHHRLMKEYATTQQNLMLDFAKVIVSNRADSVLNLTAKLHTFFSDPQRRQGSLLSDVGLGLKNLDSSACVLETSPKEVVAELASAFAVALIKGYTLVQFSYALLNDKDNGRYHEEQGKYRNEFSIWMYEVLASSKEIIQNASGELWRCDPKVHVEGETYEQFTKFMQGYIQHEIFLNKQYSCSGSCNMYQSTKNYGYTNNQIDDFSADQKCLGEVLYCENLEQEVTVCPSRDLTTRRYDFIKRKNGLIIGRKKRCSTKKHVLSSWLAFIIIGYECSYCFCYCEDDLSDRFISMRSSLSDLKNNRVVTGVRFVKDHGLIKMQVQEGKLMEYGRIDKKTVRWVPVNNFSRLSEGSYLNEDYYRLTLETNLLYLDDVQADQGYVVTGVRFKKLGSGLVFEILVTPYNFFTGKLIQPYERSFWKDNIAVFENRRQIPLHQPDIPVLRGPPHVYKKRSNEAIRFRSTDVDKDLAQTTVPFFDAQRLFSGTPVPLSGVGIFYKGRDGSGGFIAPKIITQDNSRYLPNRETRK